MIQRLTNTQLIITGTAVAGSAMIGLLLLSRSRSTNQTSVASPITKIADWVDAKGKALIPKNSGHLEHLHGGIRRRLKRHIPDLYEATEHLYLNEPYLTGA